MTAPAFTSRKLDAKVAKPVDDISDAGRVKTALIEVSVSATTAAKPRLVGRH